MAVSLPFNVEAASADSQMNQNREEVERQRIQRQIEEDQRRNQKNIEDNTQGGADSRIDGESLKFTLNDVTVDDSVVITPTVLRDIIKPYVGREVSFEDIQAIVDAMNQYYADCGLLTCRAYLKPQKIEGGVVHVSLNEAINGKVDFKGNKSTNIKYIKRRLRLREGTLQNFKHLDKDITLFNGTNDVNLRIAIKPGVEPNTTDYEIVVIEPQRITTTVSVDNLGQSNTGLLREGLNFNHASLTGIRDDLSVGYNHAAGVDSFNVGYELPISRWGTKLRLDYSTNETKHKSGEFKNLISGRSNYYGVTLTHPVAVNLNGRSEWSLGFSSQSSKNNFKNAGTFADNQSDSADLSFTQINYKPQTVIYQKHTYSVGEARNKIDDLKRNFGLYKFYGFVRSTQPHGQSLFTRLSAQIASTKSLASANTFSIGGYYSVRGYKTQFIDGDSGFDWSLEYSVPLFKRLNAFTFFDYGKITGENSLMSTGLGLKFFPADNLSSTLVVGFPLKRYFDFDTANPSRVSFICNGSF